MEDALAARQRIVVFENIAMTRFGGSNKLKQCCLNKKCVSNICSAGVYIQ